VHWKKFPRLQSTWVITLSLSMV